MKSYIQPGATIDITAPSEIVGGTLITVKNLVGIATTDSVSNFGDSLISLATEGVFSVKKASGALAQGTKVMVADATFSKDIGVVADDDSGIYVGIVTVAALSGDATVHVKLNA
jgi:predicted RecA/RadA family phage recombinase